MEKRKYQSGGDFGQYLSLANTTGWVNTAGQKSSGSSTSSESSETDIKSSDKDLLSIIKELKGLKSDEKYAMSKVSQLLMNPAIRNPQNLYQAYLQVVGLVNDLERNKVQRDEAYKKASDNNGLSELAVDDRGYIIAYDKTKGPQSITYLPVQTFISDQQSGERSKYTALTNSDLLYLRENTDLYPLNNSVFQVVENGLGLDKITNLITEITDKIKSSKLELNGYSTVQNSEISKGVDLMKEIGQMPGVGGAMMTLDGVYKSKVISNSNKQQIDSALEYIYRVLPNNARTLLAVKGGNADDPIAGAKAMIYSLIKSTVQNDLTFDADYQSDLNSDGSKKSSDDGTDKYSLNPAERFMIGSAESTKFRINTGGKAGLNVTAIKMAIPDSENKNLGQNCTLNEVSQSVFSGALDFSSIFTSNGAKLSENSLQEILVNDGNIYSMDLPYTTDENGNIHPDFSLLKKIDEINDSAKNKGIDPFNPVNREKMNEIYKKAGLPVLYSKNPNTGEWQLNSNKYHRFAAFNCTALSTAFENDPSFDIDEIEDEKQIKQVLNVLKKKNNYDPEFDEYNWMNPADWFGLHDSMYKVSVFVPMSENILSVQGGKSVATGKQIAVEAQAKHAETQRNYVNPNDYK